MPVIICEAGTFQAESTLTAVSRKHSLEQHLFLIGDTRRPGELFLHNGSKTLGRVLPRWNNGTALCDALNRLSNLEGRDQALVVSVGTLFKEYAFPATFEVQVLGFIYERIARKYVQNKEF